MATDTLVPARPQPGRRTVLSAVLVLVFAASVIAVSGERLLAVGGLDAAAEIAASLLTPELAPEFLATVAEAAALTAAYALAGMSVAVAFGLPGALLVSGVLVRRRGLRMASVAGARGVFATLRAIHELVWALLLLTILGLNPLSGILAIGIPYGATIARVLGDRLADVPAGPLNALASAGASPGQVLAYARLPQAGANITGYLFYRLECAVRTAAVLSFIGLGGIGLQIEIALAELKFGKVWTLLAALLVLVLLVDRVSAAMRRRWVT